MTPLAVFLAVTTHAHLSPNVDFKYEDVIPDEAQDFKRLAIEDMRHMDKVIDDLCADPGNKEKCSFWKGLRVCGKCQSGGLRRLGQRHDGGYLVCDPAGTKMAFSFGVNGEDSFGIDLSSETGAVVREFDCTNSAKPKCPGSDPNCKLEFFSTCVTSPTEKHKFSSAKTLEDVLGEQGVADAGDLIMKMDVEGSEWSLLAEVDPSVLKRFSQIILEFHGVDKDVSATHRQALNNLLTNFVVVHHHANNYAGATNVGGFTIPSVIELTLARKDKVVESECANAARDPGDSRNNPGSPELQLVLPKSLGQLSTADKPSDAFLNPLTPSGVRT